MKTYVTFGFDHRHQIGPHFFDKDCVAVIESPDAAAGRAKAFELFGPKFCFEYPEAFWNEDKLHFFPRGYIYLEGL
jgi:hypothetical protein